MRSFVLVACAAVLVAAGHTFTATALVALLLLSAAVDTWYESA